MAYTPTTWVELQGSGLNKYTDQNGNILELNWTPDSVTQQGTPFTAEAMNKIEQGVAEAMPKAGGTFTSRVKAATGTTDNNGEIKNCRIVNAAYNAVLGGTVYIDFQRK